MLEKLRRQRLRWLIVLCEPVNANRLNPGFAIPEPVLTRPT
jgi:hypothetical protein